MNTTLTANVCVVGAGPAGLTQAGQKIVVLEARDQVGGRTWSDEIDGQWVSPDQTSLISLLGALGLETFSRYREGQNVYIAPGGRR